MMILSFRITPAKTEKSSRSYKIRITLLPDKELPERLLRGSKKKDKTLDEELADLYGTATE